MARERLRRAIGSIYSFASDKFYEPVVVRGTFRLFGGALNELVIEQGRDAVETAAGRPLLDMPVGTGYFTVQHARLHQGLLVGVDLAEGMVREAKRAARRSGVESLQMVRADAHRLPFRDGAFGAALCSNGLQVMPGTDAILSELGRILTPDGRLYVSIVGIPLSRILPRSAVDRLPAILRTGHDLVEPLGRAGLTTIRVARARWAWLVEAAKSSP